MVIHDLHPRQPVVDPEGMQIAAPIEEPNIPDYKFVLSHQKVELDIDFSTQSLTGKVELTILPQTKELSVIKIDARQCSIPRGKVLVNGVVADFDFEDPMEALSIPDHLLWGANQYDLQRERIKHLAEDTRSRGTLEITLPRGVRVEEVDPFSENPATQRALAAARASVVDGISGPLSATPANTPKTAAEQAGRFQPLTITIPFIIKHFRDGLHFIGLAEGDARFPYAYTRHSVDPGLASCIFPCIDDPAMRCTWDITIKCSRTLGDALKKKPLPVRNNPHKPSHHGRGLVNGIVNGVKPVEEYQVPLSEEEKLLEMVVVCSGEVMNESMDIEDGTKKIQSFQVSRIVAARHIGFAIGPFEQVDLSEYREDEDGEKLGQGQALQLLGYCLPGRADEVRHSCSPLAHAVDHFTLSFGSYPFSQYSLVFVDDQIRDVEHTASLSLCSTRILYGEDIIDPEIESIRTLVHAIASQWFGVSIVPEERSDRWITIGLSHYMTALYMKHLCGNNEYLFRQKTLSDKLVKLDVDRPSLFSLGETLHLGQFEMEFMELKAPLVLFILDKRIIKASASPGLTRVLAKLVMAANTGQAEESLVSTVGFRRFVEKVTKYRQTEPFWSQWVFGAGCPILNISQKFNKKRNSVEMTISQKQDTIATQRPLKKGSFMREMKEELHGIYAGELQPVFTGPLTIRIHEADGTPYEHIVEIREGVQKIEIPYNTKYKRLKRNKRHKERVNVAPGDHGEGGEDALYYCLGDVLQTPADYAQWQLFDWDRDTEKKMDEESYEWLRVDADFEWLCEKAFTSMPSYMYVSQLQQDRDVVAQQESMKFLTQQSAHPLASTFCVRTLMDSRYFHGIRTMAVQALASHGIAETDYTGSRQLEKVYQELFCYRGTKTSRPNDFSDKRTYWVECEIPKAMAQMRNEDGYCHRDARHFILDMLRFNDNVSNEYSDYHKISILLSALAQSLVKGEPSKPAPRASAPTEDMTIQDPQERTNDLQRRVAAHVKQQDDLVQKRQEYRESDRQDYPQFKVAALEEIERYRRMDEWVNSYQNIYTTTVLDCKRLLMKEKVTPLEPLDFAQYLHDGTADLVRIKAFECLIDLGFITHKAVASLLLNLLSTDSSPYVRSHLFEVFCLGLAGVAFGENKNPDAAPGATNGEVDLMADGAEADALIVQDASTEARKAQILRTTSIEGALAALKEDLKTDEVLKDALWTAIKSTEIGVSEQQDLLDICSILYDAVESMIVKLRLPRFWGVRKGDRKGLLIFKEKNKVRTAPRKPREPPVVVVAKPPKISLPPAAPKPAPPPKAVVPPPAPAVRLSFTTNGGSMKPPKRPISQVERIPSSDGSPAKKQKVVNLKIPGQKLMEILRLPPRPSIPRGSQSSSSVRSSPAPKPSPRPSPGFAASPGPSSTISVSPAPVQPSSSSSALVKIRKPLPDSSARKPLPDSSSSTPVRKPLPDASSRKPLPDAVPKAHATSTPPVAEKKKFLIKLKTKPAKPAKPTTPPS